MKKNREKLETERNKERNCEIINNNKNNGLYLLFCVGVKLGI
jgi:hypothetical protein